MLRTIRRRGVMVIAGIGLALSIAACASQAKVQEQPLLNQLMAPNGFVLQQPGTLNQTDTNTTLPFDRVEQVPAAPASDAQPVFDRTVQAPAAAPAGESQRAMETKQDAVMYTGCGK